MHELTIAQRIVEIALEAAEADRGGRILGLRIRIGALTCIEPETLRFAIEVITAETLAKGCKVEFVRVPSRLACRACGAQADRDLLEPCPCCAAAGGEIVAGRELSLESIEVDGVPEGAGEGAGPAEPHTGVRMPSAREEQP